MSAVSPQLRHSVRRVGTTAARQAARGGNVPYGHISLAFHEKTSSFEASVARRVVERSASTAKTSYAQVDYGIKRRNDKRCNSTTHVERGVIHVVCRVHVRSTLYKNSRHFDVPGMRRPMERRLPST